MRPRSRQPGFIVSAPSSRSGKTVLTLGLIRALVERGRTVSPRKIGPDYIDPTFLAAAARRPALNLDAWAMGMDRVQARLGEGTIVAEAAMGLFDGAADGTGSAADIASGLGMPVLLVLNAAHTSHSLGAVLRGFASHRRGVRVGAVIANMLGSDRHGRMVEAALRPVCEEFGIELLGMVPRDARLALPSRHLGLVPASEREGIEAFVDDAASLVSQHVDLEGVEELGFSAPEVRHIAPCFPILGRRVAVARDEAFAFAYPHALDDWHASGVEVVPFSPLADEGPDADADAVFLPGGYPELHAPRLAASERFRTGMERAAGRGAFVYGECGGYMVLGDRLTDADGASHAMLGMLPLATSFAERRLQLGYRKLAARSRSPLGMSHAGHEHHHATIVSEGDADALFDVRDAEGNDLGVAGLRRANVCGSFMHIIASR